MPVAAKQQASIPAWLLVLKGWVNMQVRMCVTAAHLADLRSIVQKQHRAVGASAANAELTFLRAFAEVEDQVLCESPNCLAVQSGNKFKYCSRCMAIKYCCKQCQTGHWPAHKGQCKTVGAAKRGKRGA